jgi:uncharacterized protein
MGLTDESMWEVFNNFLEKAGVVASLFLLALAASGLAVRALWQSNERQRKEFLDQIDSLKASYEKSIKTLSDENQRAVDSLADELAEQISFVVRKNEDLHDKVDAIQEKRVLETRDNTQRMMAYISHMDAFVLKLDAAIDVLLKASRDGNGR